MSAIVEKNLMPNQHSKPTQWCTYILRCADNTLYTGITTNIEKRIKQHNGLLKNGAKYTRSRQPVQLVYQESCSSRASASSRENAIKSLNKQKKEQLIKKN